MHPDPRARLLRSIAWVLLAAAVLSAPGFLLAERFEAGRLARVALSNGLTALGAIALLRVSARDHIEKPARGLVFGLLALVAALAWSSGEDVHVNVVNFVLVTVLAGTLLERAGLAIVGATSAIVLVAIACKQHGGTGELESVLESIGQFLPTYAVIVFVLWFALPLRNLGRFADRSTPIPD